MRHYIISIKNKESSSLLKLQKKNAQNDKLCFETHTEREASTESIEIALNKYSNETLFKRRMVFFFGLSMYSNYK